MSAIGIDLGTTNCVIAYLDDQFKPTVISNQLGETITPSVICFKPDEIIVGTEAKELQEAEVRSSPGHHRHHPGGQFAARPVRSRDHSLQWYSRFRAGCDAPA